MSAKDSPLASGANESIEWNFKLIGQPTGGNRRGINGGGCNGQVGQFASAAMVLAALTHVAITENVVRHGQHDDRKLVAVRGKCFLDEFVHFAAMRTRVIKELDDQMLRLGIPQPRVFIDIEL